VVGRVSCHWTSAATAMREMTVAGTGMATSNRDRIDRGLQLVAQGLRPIVDSVMSPAAPAGQDWVEAYAARQNRNGGNMRFSADDPRFLLRVITEEARLFQRQVSRAQQSFVSELRETGNRWAHNEAFSAEDTHRALDTMERLLTAAGAMTQADAIRDMRREAQQLALNSQTRKAIKAIAGVEGTDLKPWREVITPHQDVRDGKLRGAEFAADLYQVACGEGSAEYKEPVEFFRRTYLTEGLRTLLASAARRLTGDQNASPVWNLQTNFGGGKTHSMLALWHLVSGKPVTSFPEELQHLLAGAVAAPLPETRRAALVGNHTIGAGQGSVKGDGTHVQTLWGELAWQLGQSAGGDEEARRAYEIVRDADETRSNPAAALGTLIRSYAPCLILIDEWVAYARQLYGREDLKGGTFDTQFTFAQTLTEAVKAVPGALLVVSIPAPAADEAGRHATDIEVGGLNGERALEGLLRAVGRVAEQWRPATPVESFAIVRQRLFEEPSGEALADIEHVARSFVAFYARHRTEFPAEAAEISYEERIRQAYPIHPELFDRLYQDWSTLDRFQRTRGVLRLMSAVIHTLWKKDQAPLILPGGIPLEADDVLKEISQYVEDNFSPVITTDIDGTSATPNRIDMVRPIYGKRNITLRIARSLFFASAATLRAAHKGADYPRIWLGMATPGDTVGNYGSALALLSEQATYLYNEGSRYWFSVTASVARLAREGAERLKDSPYQTWEEVLRRLREREASRGMFAKIPLIGPDKSDDIPDDQVARLVIISPEHRHTRKETESSPAAVWATKAVMTKGSAHRINRNMLVFLAADSRDYDSLDEAVRQYLAWKEVATEERMHELALPPQQVTQALRQLRTADDTVSQRISRAYIWLLVPTQSARAGGGVALDEMKADTGEDRLVKRAADKLHNMDRLRKVQGPQNIRGDLDGPLSSVWSHGHIAIGELWEYYCKYFYMNRLVNRSVLEEGIRRIFDELTWNTNGFAVASGFDEETGTYLGLCIPMEDVPPSLTDSALLVHPDRALAQREAEHTAAAAARTAAETATSESATVCAGDEVSRPGISSMLASDDRRPLSFITAMAPETPQAPRNTRFFGVVRVDPERYVRDLNRLHQEVIQHLAAPDGVELEISVEIKAVKRDGYPDDKVRIVSENARTLKFDPGEFEDR
jgi:predicted AAA+ superfamily ATPase